MVKEKAVVETDVRPSGKLPLFGRHPLGSYMGTKGITAEERRSKVSGDNTRYEKMKAMADRAQREGSPEDCGRLVERVGERLYLPRVVVLQAAAIAKRAMVSPHPGRRRTVADVSAYALVSACKIEGVTSVSIREILAAFADVGRKVTSSAIFRLAIESPSGTYAREPRDYVPRVVARLSMNRRLAARLARDGAAPPAYLGSLRMAASEILGACDRTEMSGKRPCTLAASAVYSAEILMSSAEGRAARVTQRECAECGDAAEYTVREQYNAIFTPVLRRMSRPTLSLPPQAGR